MRKNDIICFVCGFVFTTGFLYFAAVAFPNMVVKSWEKDIEKAINKEIGIRMNKAILDEIQKQLASPPAS